MRHTNPTHGMIKLLTGLSAAMLITTLHAADAEFCMQYSRDMISVPHDREDAPKTCHADQPHWNTDKSAHVKACLGMSQAAANKKRYNHNKLVNLCNDTYKIIMLDRKRVATLPLSPDEPREMQPAPADLKEQLTSDSLQNPYAKLYPDIQQALQQNKLNNCDFYRLPVDMDNNPKSREWVVTIDEKCTTKAIGSQQPHVWIIQQTENNTPRILFEGQHYTLTLHYTENHHYRNLSIASELNKQEETDKRCGSIIADWHYEQGRYVPFKGKADEHGSCLPEYELPDYLQGANTLELGEGEWQKGMEKAEKERSALMAPYKQALQDYVPEWIKKIQQLVPAVTSESKNATPQQTKTTTETQQENTTEKTKDKKAKSFMDTVREFLNLK